MAQQQQPRREECHNNANISRTDDREQDSDVRKNHEFQSGTAVDRVAAYPVAAYAYEATVTAPGVGGGGGGGDIGNYGTTRYEYTAVYDTTAPAPGFAQWGQEANTDGRGNHNTTGMNRDNK